MTEVQQSGICARCTAHKQATHNGFESVPVNVALRCVENQTKRQSGLKALPFSPSGFHLLCLRKRERDRGEVPSREDKASAHTHDKRNSCVTCRSRKNSRIQLFHGWATKFITQFSANVFLPH